MASEQIVRAQALIEQTRYKIGTHEFLLSFIDWWAFLHSGLFPTVALQKEPKLFNLAGELSYLLSEIMLSGNHDPLSTLLSDYSPSTRSTFDFYPTPQGVSELISRLVAEPHSLAGTGAISIYEPCVGTSGLIFEKIKQIASARSEQSNPLAGVSIRVEDINPYAVKAFFLQFNFLMQHLATSYGKELIPDSVQIVCCDVLSRKQGAVSYYLSNPSIAQTNECFWAQDLAVGE
ncbi:N-6 DNA methylase [Vibrio parahaemolyticus]|uniref:N-6 DNA methylase n=1 Tax=Vibrio parahaemolyticus TaxID=670 RepID=UPI00081343BD|nr:N-6 DNA methylase [Vibrio parahaemolyticus]OCP68375.1 hypothetical protein AKH08_16315 [Vibrio parahaemolyticus]